tara:strand:+ start:7068 stop:7619 length:552 start_codon:yes stop_codon:yes gene_type:complete
MILPIVSFGSPILRKECRTVDFSYSDLNKLITNMWETMYNASGVGLAAPQVNQQIKLFIIDTKPFCEEEDIQPCKRVFINPEIIVEEGDEWEFNEGCLSIPNIREDILRKPNITIRYQDENFKEFIETYNGITARVIQHEYDHVNGILFIDKISSLRKRMIKGKLNDIAKGKVSTSYRMKIFK